MLAQIVCILIITVGLNLTLIYLYYTISENKRERSMNIHSPVLLLCVLHLFYLFLVPYHCTAIIFSGRNGGRGEKVTIIYLFSVLCKQIHLLERKLK